MYLKADSLDTNPHCYLLTRRRHFVLYRQNQGGMTFPRIYILVCFLLTVADKIHLHLCVGVAGCSPLLNIQGNLRYSIVYDRFRSHEDKPTKKDMRFLGTDTADRSFNTLLLLGVCLFYCIAWFFRLAYSFSYVSFHHPQS